MLLPVGRIRAGSAPIAPFEAHLRGAASKARADASAARDATACARGAGLTGENRAAAVTRAGPVAGSTFAFALPELVAEGDGEAA